MYFTLKNADVPRKGGHAEKREKKALLCRHYPSERGPTEGRGAGSGCLCLCAPSPQREAGKELACQCMHVWKILFPPAV